MTEFPIPSADSFAMPSSLQASTTGCALEVDWAVTKVEVGSTKVAVEPSEGDAEAGKDGGFSSCWSLLHTRWTVVSAAG